jgi:ABC-type transport system involved in cytochrome bd biosynthesis fused ATPase/permease subunit
VAHADRILVLEDGRIVQEGAHDELVRQPGAYRRLWEIQGALETETAVDLALAAGSDAAGGGS